MNSNQLDINGMIMHEYRHFYSDEELRQLKDDSIKIRNEIDNLEEEKKAVTATFAAEIKTRKKEDKKLRIGVNVGFEDRREKVKVLMDYNSGMVEFWNQEGIKVDERKMTRKEIAEGQFVHN